MTRTSAALVGFIALSVVALLMPGARADAKQVKPTGTWTGSVDDEKLMKDAPGIVTRAEVFEKLWKDWKILDKPEVDFTKEFLLVLTVPKGRFIGRPTLSLDAKGDLGLNAQATVEALPGFRYWIAKVSREGVKTFGGKALPKD